MTFILWGKEFLRSPIEDTYLSIAKINENTSEYHRIQRIPKKQVKAIYPRSFSVEQTITKITNRRCLSINN